MIRVVLPTHLRKLARVDGEVQLEVEGRVTQRSVLDALENRYPTLRGTYCSMSGDLGTGRTEIDYYNGHLIELAGARPCPLNRAVYELVKRMERDKTQPHRAVLEEFAA